MSLTGYLLETGLGTRDKAPLSVGLFLRDQEVDVPGYERIALQWRLTDRSASTSVTFGPYSGNTSYDRYVLFSGDDVIDEIPERSAASFPQGFVWEWKPELVLGT